MEYEKFHILDFNIEDETQQRGRDISIFVDTHEMVNIEIGNTVTIRTNEAGIDDLRDGLIRALRQLEEVRYLNSREASAKLAEDTMIEEGIKGREEKKRLARSEQQSIDPYETFNPNDPINW